MTTSTAELTMPIKGTDSYSEGKFHALRLVHSHYLELDLADPARNDAVRRMNAIVASTTVGLEFKRGLRDGLAELIGYLTPGE